MSAITPKVFVTFPFFCCEVIFDFSILELILLTDVIKLLIFMTCHLIPYPPTICEFTFTMNIFSSNKMLMFYVCLQNLWCRKGGQTSSFIIYLWCRSALKYIWIYLRTIKYVNDNKLKAYRLIDNNSSQCWNRYLLICKRLLKGLIWITFLKYLTIFNWRYGNFQSNCLRCAKYFQWPQKLTKIVCECKRHRKLGLCN